MEKIDFVIPWVDGNDPKWLAEKKKWLDDKDQDISTGKDANGECRYRSDDKMLRYWFRSVERFAPWVNRIHFVTCGQKPFWLDENHPKLHLVNHQEFIPSKYLPTYNANTIEMNFHRIAELSVQYVYFNDDNYLLQKVEPEFFFQDGKPVLDTNLRYTELIEYSNWSRLAFNDYCIVNRSFDVGKSIWDNRKKWFNISELGYKRARRNLACYLANKTLPVNLYGHVALPHLKSTLAEVWEQHYDVMDQMCMHKFRNDDQVNQWLLCAWNQAKGDFYPAHEKNLGINVTFGPDSVGWVCEIIRSQSAPQICVNDSLFNTDPIRCGMEIEKAFDCILPDKSAFEWD